MIKRILLVVVVALACLIFGTWLNQRDNISALKTAANNTKEQLQTMAEDNKQAVQQIIEKLPETAERIELPESLTEQLQKGEISTEDAVSAVVESITQKPAEPKPETEPATTPSKEEMPKEDPALQEQLQKDKDRITELVAKVYVLQASYSGQITALEEEAKAEYKALPAAERTKAKQLAIVMKYLGKISDLEDTCDGQMSEIVKELKTLLQKTGGDESVSDEIQAAYKKEKEVQKAQYISKYAEYLK